MQRPSGTPIVLVQPEWNGQEKIYLCIRILCMSFFEKYSVADIKLENH